MIQDMTTQAATVVTDDQAGIDRPRMHRGAIVAMVCAVAWLPGWYLFALIGVIIGHRTLREVKKTELRGIWVTTSALILSYIGLLAWLIHTI